MRGEQLTENNEPIHIIGEVSIYREENINELRSRKL